MKNKKDNKMVWRHIEEDLQKKIFNGVIKENMKFPSYSEISNQYNVDRNTALKVCKSLESKNIIYRKIGLGFFLKPGAKDKIKEEQINNIESIIKQLKKEINFFEISKEEVIKILDLYMED